MLDRNSLIALITQLQNFDGSEEEEDLFLKELEKQVLDPQLSDYIYLTDMNAEQIADKVLSYQPIILSDLS